MASWLSEQRLSGGASRSRTRFVETLSTAVQTMEKERQAIIEAVVNKEEDGKTWKKIPATEGQEEKWDIPVDKLPELEKEYGALLDESFILDITEANREIIKSVSHILLDTDYLFGPRENDSRDEVIARVRQMNDYPKWCEAFEGLELA